MSPGPGAHVISGGIQFAVTSRHADSVILCLFDGARESRVTMQRQGDIHVATVTAAGPDSVTASAPTVHGHPSRACCSIRPSCCWIPMRRALDAPFSYDPRLALRGADTAALVPKAVVTAPLPIRPVASAALASRAA